MRLEGLAVVAESSPLSVFVHPIENGRLTLGPAPEVDEDPWIQTRLGSSVGSARRGG